MENSPTNKTATGLWQTAERRELGVGEFEVVNDLGHHGKTARCLQLAEKMGSCAVEGHYHNSFSIEYYGTPFALNWSMQVGCFVDFKSLAFSYANVNIKRQNTWYS